MHALFILAVMFISAWFGGANLHQMLDWRDAFFYIVVFVGTYIVWHWLLVFRQRALALIFITLIGMLCYLAGGTYRYVNSDMPLITEGADAPVGIKFEYKNNIRTGKVYISNLDATRPLVRAEVMCTLFYDNGTPVGKTFPTGIAGPNIYMPGEGRLVTAFNDYDIADYRSNREAVTCKLTSAQFNKPLVLLALRFEEAQDGRTDFYVTNNGTRSVKNLQFTCAKNDAIEKVVAYPAYTIANVDTIVAPGATAKFSSDDKWMNYKSCTIMNALEM